MRIFFIALIAFLGIHVYITVMNSKTVNVIQERNAALEALLKPPSNVIK